MKTVHKWGVFEVEFKSSFNYVDPLRDVNLHCIFKSPGGREFSVEGFWDGDSTWRIRFMPDELGIWTYRTVCSNTDDDGLHDQAGLFECTSYDGENPIYIHGALKLSDNRRYLIHADGSPFFWLADTAWNGVLRSTVAEWSEYLKIRREQGFTAVQFVMTHWRGGPYDIERETAYEGRERIVKLNVKFFKRIDVKFSMVNEYGLVAAPVLLWAIKDDISPGSNLTDEDALLLVRYLVARYGAYILVWILAGDGDYRGEKAERWKRIGRTVFHGRFRQPVAMHPAGRHWILPDFLAEEWLDIIGYQSGHGISEDDLKWLCFGPPSRDWHLEPVRPFINLEPNYEGHLAYSVFKPITPHMVRRVAYWSLLIAPTAGVSYGTNGVWYWCRMPEIPVNHPHVGVAKPWRESVRLPGAWHMSRLKRIFSKIPWWTLRPDPEMIIDEPGLKNVELFVAACRSEDGRIAVIYTPEIQNLNLNLSKLKKPFEALWVNPRREEEFKAGIFTDDILSLTPPEPGDWLLILRTVD